MRMAPSISRGAELVLLNCHTAATYEDLAREVKPRQFRICSASRELTAGGLLEPVGDKFLNTDKGYQALEGSTKV
jgi:hypothetical protein